VSGPIVPPLEVTEVDGSPSGRPITKIIVSNGDLSISGRTATIDTTGSGGTPGGSDSEVQYNDGGAFGGAADFTFTDIGAAIPKLNILSATTANKGIYSPQSITLDGGTGLPTISTTDGDDGLYLDTGSDGADGPLLNLISSDGAATPHLSLRNGATDGTITIDTTVGTGDITVNAKGDLNLYGDSDSVVLRHQSGGSVYATSATDEDAILGITSVGTGTPRLDIQSPSNRVWVLCDSNKKLKVQGGSGGDTFIFDVSSATGGITFPDSTTLVSAEGTAILSTGESGGTKFLREDGDGTCSWQAAGGGASPTPTFSGVKANANAYYDLSSYPTGWRAEPYADVAESQSAPIYCPFTCGLDMTVATLGINVQSAGTAGLTYELGVFSTDSDGLPDALLFSCTVDADATGQQTATVSEESAGDADITAGTQYYYCYTQSTDAVSNPTLRSANAQFFGSITDSTIGTQRMSIRAGVLGTMPTTYPGSGVALGTSCAIVGATYT